ncbi:hypothetical protein ACU64_16095 [Escherichia coli]|nr:hypothetical protein ACU64_16095 [Escherichia coli]PDV68483.1 hypothetical protein BER08_26345 [Escherichia coli]
MLYLIILAIVLWGIMLFLLMRAIYVDLKRLKKIYNTLIMQKQNLYNTPCCSGYEPHWVNLLDAFFIFISLLISFLVIVLLLLAIDYQ